MMMYGTLLGIAILAGLIYLYLRLSNHFFSSSREELAKLDKYGAAGEEAQKSDETLLQDIADFSGDVDVGD